MNRASHVCSSQQPPVSLGADDRRIIDRREFLWRFGGGLGGIALAHLLATEGLLAETPSNGKPGQASAAGKGVLKGLHHPARAKRVVQLFMSGAASQCDM